MKNNDFDFIKDKFDNCELDVPDSLDARMIEYKILTNKKYKVIHFKQKKNLKPIISAAACFIIVLGVVFASVSGIINNDKVFTFKNYDELYTRISSLEKNVTDGENGGPMKPHLYKDIDGVETADVVKTDGKYLYCIYENKVYIFETDKNSTKLASVIDCSDNDNAENLLNDVYGLLIYNNRLVVQINRRNILLSEQYQCDVSASITRIYDIGDKASPSLLYEFEQSGGYKSARLIENKLYVITNYTLTDGNTENILPYIKNGSETTYASPKNIAVVGRSKGAQYAVISKTDVETGEHTQPLKAVLGGDADVQFTKDYIYVSEYIYDAVDDDNNMTENTEVIKLNLNNYKFSYADNAEISQLSDDIELNGYEAFTGALYSVDNKFLCIGEDINTVTDELILYDENMNEIDSLVLDSMQLLSQKLFMNEETSKFVLPVYAADDEIRYYGIAVFKIQNDKIVLVDTIFDEELFMSGNNQFVMIDDYFYCFAEDSNFDDTEKVKVFAFKY